VARVLVVDDDAAIRRLLELNFELEGHDVLAASDGQEALEALRSDSVDVAVVDIAMPKLDGWQLRQAMLGDEDLADIPVIFLSAGTRDEDTRRGRELGGQYVTKPFDPADLLRLVHSLLTLDPR
jgi:DNA-binding response OmpR family regulator